MTTGQRLVRWLAWLQNDLAGVPCLPQVVSFFGNEGLEISVLLLVDSSQRLAPPFLEGGCSALSVGSVGA